MLQLRGSVMHSINFTDLYPNYHILSIMIGRALECISHIALAIGKEESRAYLYKGMESVIEAEGLGDEGLSEYSYVFISNAAKVLGAGFCQLK